MSSDKCGYLYKVAPSNIYLPGEESTYSQTPSIKRIFRPLIPAISFYLLPHEHNNQYKRTIHIKAPCLPYFLVEIDIQNDIKDVMDYVNTNCIIVNHGFNIDLLVDYKCVELLPLVGYNMKQQPRTLYKIYYMHKYIFQYDYKYVKNSWENHSLEEKAHPLPEDEYHDIYDDLLLCLKNCPIDIHIHEDKSRNNTILQYLTTHQFKLHSWILYPNNTLCNTLLHSAHKGYPIILHHMSLKYFQSYDIENDPYQLRIPSIPRLDIVLCTIVDDCMYYFRFLLGSTQDKDSVLNINEIKKYNIKDILDCDIIISDIPLSTMLIYMSKDFLPKSLTYMDLSIVISKLQVYPPLNTFILDDLVHNEVLFPIKQMSSSMLQFKSIYGAPNIQMDEKKNQYIIHIDTPEDRLRAWYYLLCKRNIILEYMNYSNISRSINITNCVEGGLSGRIYAAIYSYATERKYFINTDMMNHTPLIINRSKNDSSCPNPFIMEEIKTPYTMDITLTNSNKIIMEDITTLPTRKMHGGLNQTPSTGIHYDPVITLDFASLYPNIIIGNNICPTLFLYHNEKDNNRANLELLHSGKVKVALLPIGNDKCVILITHHLVENKWISTPTIIPGLINEAVERRNIYKYKKNETTCPIEKSLLDAKQLSLKVLANSIYGFWGATFSKIYLPEFMGVVCSLGQFYITIVQKLAEENNTPVVYGDTDSVMIKYTTNPNKPAPEELKRIYHEAVEFANLCTTHFPEPNLLEFESLKIPYYIQTKKQYACWEYGPKINDWLKKPDLLIKGLAFKKNDRCEFIRNLGKAIIPHLLAQRKNEVKKLLIDCVTNFTSGIMDMSQFVITCLIQPLHTYKSTSLIHLEVVKRMKSRNITVQDNTRIQYVILRGNKQLYLRGEEYKYAKQHHLKLDYVYYLEKQLISAMDGMLKYLFTGEEIDHLYRLLRHKANRANSDTLDIATYFEQFTYKKTRIK